MTINTGNYKVAEAYKTEQESFQERQTKMSKYLSQNEILVVPNNLVASVLPDFLPRLDIMEDSQLIKELKHKKKFKKTKAFLKNLGERRNGLKFSEYLNEDSISMIKEKMKPSDEEVVKQFVESLK